MDCLSRKMMERRWIDQLDSFSIEVRSIDHFYAYSKPLSVFWNPLWIKVLTDFITIIDGISGRIIEGSSWSLTRMILQYRGLLMNLQLPILKTVSSSLSVTSGSHFRFNSRFTSDSPSLRKGLDKQFFIQLWQLFFCRRSQ